MTPPQYYAALQQQGLSPYQAYIAVQANYGNPQDYVNRQNAKQGQSSALGQTVGSIGGLLVGQEAIRGFPNVSGLFGNGAGAGAGAGATQTATPSVATPEVIGATKIGGETAASSVSSMALPVAATALQLNNIWESGMKDIVRGKADRADWTNQAVNMFPYTAPINIGLRLFGKRSVGKMMTTGKSDAQLMRDDFRGVLKETGVADKNYHVTLADGSKFNIGLDGKTRYKNVGENIDGKTERQAWDMDHSNPLALFATSQIDPMIRNIYGPEAEKAGIKPEQYTGMFVNAVTSNAKSEQDVKNNIAAMLGKSIFAKQVGMGTPPIKPAVPAKGQVVRTSPGMYMNDKGHVGPAKTVREALRANYNAGKGK
jgi:hypothetical protein